jgi:hypothetical protein
MIMQKFVDRLARHFISSTGLLERLNQLSAVTTDVYQQVADIQLHRNLYVDRGTQILLRLKYQELAAHGKRLPFDQVEFRNYSQNGEDGVLWYVFSLLGETNKVCVEICASNGIQCNCANLLINHGWTGLLVDGNSTYVAMGREYYARHPDTFIFPPKFAKAWVTAENVNQILSDNGVCGEVDLLSLDIDGMDYWVWQAMTAIRPRVVIAEIQTIWGADASVTVPYSADFTTELVDGFGVYCGASLPAFVKLAKTKDYRLVGAQRYGFNAIFVRNDVGADVLPEVDPEDCLRHPFAAWTREALLPGVVDREWLKV